MYKSAARRLQCGIPKVKKRWQEAYKRALQTHNGFKRQFQLEREIQEKGMNEERAEKFETMIKIRDECTKYADKKCRKIPMGNVPFSPTIVKARLSIELWKGVVTRKRGSKFSSKKLHRIERKIGITNSMNCTLDQAIQKEDKARSEYNQLKKDANKLRYKFLKQRATELAETSNTTSDNIYNQLIEREKQREAARKIKFTLGNAGKKRITTIECNQNGSTVELTTRNEIESECI